MINDNKAQLFNKFYKLDLKRAILLNEAIRIYKDNKGIDINKLIKPINEITEEINLIAQVSIVPNREKISVSFFLNSNTRQ
jgi:hypothetical protein